MSKTSRRIFTDEFKKEAVRQTEMSGLTIVEVAANLGIGLSSLTRWKRNFREADLLSGPHMDVTIGVNEALLQFRRGHEKEKTDRRHSKRTQRRIHPNPTPHYMNPSLRSAAQTPRP